jgi:hypothetical protein
MKTSLPVICLLTLTGCAGTPSAGYIQPVAIDVDEHDQFALSMGIPWGDFVIACAHAGKHVAEHVDTTTIWTKDGPRSVVGPPVFSDENDWCLLRPSKPVEKVDIVLSWKPRWRMYIVLTPLDGGETHLVRCRLGEWPSGYGSPHDESPSGEPATAPSQPTAPKRGSTFGLRAPLVTEEPIRPGNSGSQVVFYDPWTRKFSVCGLVAGADERYPGVVSIVPFWWGVGEELLAKRQNAERNAAALSNVEIEGEKGGDQAP